MSFFTKLCYNNYNKYWIVIVQNILLFGYKTDVLLCTHKSFIDQSILYAKKVTLAKKFLPRGYKGFKSRAYGILDSQEF